MSLTESLLLLYEPQTRCTRPNKWKVSWINYTQVIEDNFESFVQKYCPEPEKILPLFRELRTEHLSFL